MQDVTIFIGPYCDSYVCNPGASLHKLVFLDSPAEDLEHWQQLEKVLEVLDHKEPQQSSTDLAFPREDDLAPQDACLEVRDVKVRHHTSSAGARSGEDAGQTAGPMGGSERQSMRGVPVRPGGAQCAGPHHLASQLMQQDSQAVAFSWLCALLLQLQDL